LLKTFPSKSNAKIDKSAFNDVNVVNATFLITKVWHSNFAFICSIVIKICNENVVLVKDLIWHPTAI